MTFPLITCRPGVHESETNGLPCHHYVERASFVNAEWRPRSYRQSQINTTVDKWNS